MHRIQWIALAAVGLVTVAQPGVADPPKNDNSTTSTPSKVNQEESTRPNRARTPLGEDWKRELPDKDLIRAIALTQDYTELLGRARTAGLKGVDTAVTSFEHAFGSGLEGVCVEMERRKPGFREHLLPMFQQSTKSRVDALALDQSHIEELLELMRNPAKLGPPDPTDLLLACRADYHDHPEQELNDGFTKFWDMTVPRDTNHVLRTEAPRSWRPIDTKTDDRWFMSAGLGHGPFWLNLAIFVPDANSRVDDAAMVQVLDRATSLLPNPHRGFGQRTAKVGNTQAYVAEFAYETKGKNGLLRQAHGEHWSFRIENIYVVWTEFVVESRDAQEPERTDTEMRTLLNRYSALADRMRRGLRLVAAASQPKGKDAPPDNR